MTIEFHTPYGKVPEKLIAAIRTNILELAHINKKITRAEVSLKVDEEIITGENKVCEIRLSYYGDDLFVRRYTVKFEKSVKEAIKELKKLVGQQVKRQPETRQPFFSKV